MRRNVFNPSVGSTPPIQLIIASGPRPVLMQRLTANHAFSGGRTLSPPIPAIRSAGFNPWPWQESTLIPEIGANTANGDSVAGDRLSINSWSDLNCFDNRNPVKGANGEPEFFVRQFTWDLNSDHHLTLECRYGRSLTELSTQVRRQGLIPGVEVFELIYGEDLDAGGESEEEGEEEEEESKDYASQSDSESEDEGRR